MSPDGSIPANVRGNHLQVLLVLSLDHPPGLSPQSCGETPGFSITGLISSEGGSRFRPWAGKPWGRASPPNNGVHAVGKISPLVTGNGTSTRQRISSQLDGRLVPRSVRGNSEGIGFLEVHGVLPLPSLESPAPCGETLSRFQSANITRSQQGYDRLAKCGETR